MRNSKQLFQDFTDQLTSEEDSGERRAIGLRVFENMFGLSPLQIMAGRPLTPTQDELDRLSDIVGRLQQHEPIQYILGEAEFLGRVFKVNNSVLIPRPETEHLVQEILLHSNLSSMLDIGTGSGCIPITLAVEREKLKVSATDISEEALGVARSNAERLEADVNFFRHDILNEILAVKELDVVVSNPPYIAESEKAQMRQNVVDYEPHQALFVPNENPLLFYTAIAKKSFAVLKPSGMLIVEINERLAREVAETFEANRFQSVQILKDLSGKDRVVKGYKTN